MSSLQVDSISSMGGGHVDGAGLVVQYVETSDNDVVTSIDIDSTSFVSTGITLSFTPKFIGSKVCVEYRGSMAKVLANATLSLTLFKDGVQAMGNYGLGFLDGRSGFDMFTPAVGQYIFTTTSLTTIAFTVYARRGTGTGDVRPVVNASSYIFSATEYAQ